MAENADVSVLLLEAGGSDDDASVKDASAWPSLRGGEHDWAFRAKPNPRLNGRAIPMAMGKVLGGGSTAASGKSDTGDGPNLQLPRLRCGFSRQHRRQQHAVVCEPRLIADHRMAWRPSAHPVSSSTSRAAAIPLPTMTSGSLTGYPYSAPDCDHMLRKSCSRTACHRRCPTHPPLPASSHPPDAVALARPA